MSLTDTKSIQKEKERIKTLKRYNILDTPADGSFDHITRLAAKLFNVPIAIVTLVDTDRIWFKSRYGIEVDQISRDPGLCSSAILSDDLYIVEDAINDPRTLANPLVASEFGLQFYAAAPLKVKGGFNLGTLCIIDKNPRQLTKNEQGILQDLTDILIDEIELRLAARTAVSKQNQLLSVAAHDMKNPLTIIPLWAGLIQQEKDDQDAIVKMCNKIKEASTKMVEMINELLESARLEASEVQLNFSIINFANLVERVVATNKVLANNKNQKLQINIVNRPLVFADENRLTEIIENLVNNAIKYSSKDTEITVNVKERDNKAILEVIDQGQGLSNEDKKYLFQRFSRLSSKPTGGESSTGLGLSIVKSLVQAHNGTISAESEGKNKGATFIVGIPVTREEQQTKGFKRSITL